MRNESKKKEDKQANKKKVIFGDRSPLQDLNGVLIHRKNCRKNCKDSTFASVSVKASKCCLRPLHTFSSSSSKTLLKKKPEPQINYASSIVQKSAPAAAGSPTVVRSKDSLILKKSPFQNPGKNQHPFLYLRKNNKTSSISSGNHKSVKKLKNGVGECGAKLKNVQQTGPGESTVELFGVSSNNNSFKGVENFTPAGKLPCSSGLEFADLDDNKNVIEDSIPRTIDSNSCSDAKTPPIEASVSPELPCGSHLNALVSTAVVTPICYGAGHLLSGVSDKRKCRPRGILTVASENSNIFEYGSNEGKIVMESRASLIPTPAEASLHWLMSPCDEDHEGNGGDFEKRLEHFGAIPGNDSVLLDLGSSPSTLSGNASDFVCNSVSYGVSGNVGDTASNGKTINVLLSPERVAELQELLVPSSEEMNKYCLAQTTHCSPTHNVFNSHEDRNYSSNRIGDSAAASVGSLSSGNVIQTPDSNSFSDRHIDNHEDQRHHFELEFDSVSEILHGVSLLPRIKMSICDVPCLDVHCINLASHSLPINPNQLSQKNLGKTSSVFDSMSDSISLSQMRISWMDELGSHTFETDDFDCCRCLSDEEVDAEGCSDNLLIAYPGNESNANKENDILRKNDLKPPVLEGESNIFQMGKRLLSPHRRNSCAESICTNGGGLLASGDSDWTSCSKDRFF